MPPEPAARAAALTVLNAALPGEAAWDAWLSDRVAVMVRWRALVQVERNLERTPAAAVLPPEGAARDFTTPGLILPDLGLLAPRELSAVRSAVTVHTLRRLPDDRRLGRLRLLDAAVDWREHLGELPARLAAPLPWDALLDGWREWSVRRWVVGCPWPHVLAELLESGAAGDATEPLGDRLQAAGHALARTGGDREAAAIVLGAERCPLECEAAVAFARSVARGARPLTAPWTDDERTGLREVLAALPERFDAPEVPELAPWRAELTAWLRDGAGASLQQLLRLRPLSGPVLPPGLPGAPAPLRPVPAAAGAAGAADDFPSAAPSWVAKVAPELVDACLALATVDSDAETTAHRLLGIAFPDTVAVARELAWLDEALREHGNSESPGSGPHSLPEGPRAAEALKRRRAAMARLLAGPATLSPVRLARLDAEVRRAARRRHLEAWTEGARLAAAHSLVRRLGPLPGAEVIGEPDLKRLGPLLEPRYARLLGALRELTRGFQALARDLLRVRLGPPPWDLRQQPANAARLAALRRLGVDVAAWLDAPFARDVTMPDGEVLRLELERDPLEVLRMGEHFGTCLSPGGVNFFSAVANAVDAHRGVLFARQADGTPAARMLVCLTDDGGLLSYQLYAHRAEEALEVEFKDALVALSRRLGTPLVAEGRVSLALAPRWYDDGAMRRGEDARFSPALLSSLPHLPTSQLVQRAREDLTPEGAEPPPAPMVLQWLLALPDAHLTAEQLEGLAGALTNLPPDDTTWMRVAGRLVAHGRLDLPLRWSRSRLEPLVQRALTGDAHAAWGLTLALEHHPGALLRALPAASRCSGCPWTRDGSASLWASRAALALHRQREALRYLDHAESPDVHQDLTDAESAEARALRALLSGE